MTAADYAWIIDIDHLPDLCSPEGTNYNAVGVRGPHDAGDNALCTLADGFGEQFRIYDDDGELYYTGRIAGDYEGFEPLDDFGGPNAGATDIKYLNKKTGKWELL